VTRAAWLNVVGIQATLRWHRSQLSVDLNPLLWLAVFPVAILPLWQVEQEPGFAIPWLYLAPKKVTLLVWQTSQGSVVTI
jgi:hypothetical protein